MTKRRRPRPVVCRKCRHRHCCQSVIEGRNKRKAAAERRAARAEAEAAALVERARLQRKAREQAQLAEQREAQARELAGFVFAMRSNGLSYRRIGRLANVPEQEAERIDAGVAATIAGWWHRHLTESPPEPKTWDERLAMEANEAWQWPTPTTDAPLPVSFPRDHASAGEVIRPPAP